MDNDGIERLVKASEKLRQGIERFNDPNSVFCSFCGKEKSEVERLFAGPTERVHICNECVIVCHEILSGESNKDV